MWMTMTLQNGKEDKRYGFEKRTAQGKLEEMGINCHCSCVRKEYSA